MIIHNMSNVIYDTFKDMGIENIGELTYPHKRQLLHASTYVSSAELSNISR